MEKESKLAHPATIFVLTTLSLLLLLMILAAIFPSTFERMGITVFHNRQTGVFSDCFVKPGEDETDCKVKGKRRKAVPEEARIGSYVKRNVMKKPRIGYFKLSD
ncbi:MAG: hypothetical protein D6808_07865 [Candidatus Dadabacteria bacterium]|nr:MAG: hypothetical protein D6808_07865 [Candidatus Dadabacteria bacterium]